MPLLFVNRLLINDHNMLLGLHTSALLHNANTQLLVVENCRLNRMIRRNTESKDQQTTEVLKEIHTRM